MPDQNDALRRKWNRRHAENQAPPQAARVLCENRHLLPAVGDALDLACGLGGNSLLLAEAGMRVAAWDLSPVAIARLRGQARPGIRAEVRDVIAAPPVAKSFDVIVVSYFLHRPLLPALVEALRPDGLLFYETFGPRIVGIGPEKAGFRLRRSELPGLLLDLIPCYYREDGAAGDLSEGFRDRVMLVGQRLAACSYE